MKKRFTEEQIIRILKEHEGGKKAADIVREHGIAEQTFYRKTLILRPLARVSDTKSKPPDIHRLTLSGLPRFSEGHFFFLFLIANPASL